MNPAATPPTRRTRPSGSIRRSVPVPTIAIDNGQPGAPAGCDGHLVPSAGGGVVCMPQPGGTGGGVLVWTCAHQPLNAANSGISVGFVTTGALWWAGDGGCGLTGGAIGAPARADTTGAAGMAVVADAGAAAARAAGAVDLGAEAAPKRTGSKSLARCGRAAGSCEKPADDRPGVCRNLVQIRRLADVADDDLLVGRASKWRRTGEQLKGNDTQAVEVGSAVHRAFGREVGRGAPASRW